MSQCDGYVSTINGLQSLVSIGGRFSVCDPTGTSTTRCDREAERRWREYRLCLPHYRIVKGSAAPRIIDEDDEHVIAEVLAPGLPNEEEEDD